MRNIMLIAIFAAAHAACVSRTEVKRGFYNAPPAEHSTGLTVALYMPQGVGAATEFPVKGYNPRGQATGLTMKVTIPDFELAISSALAALFVVERVEHSDAGRSADLLVTPTSTDLKEIGLRFMDPQTKAELARFVKPGVSGFKDTQSGGWKVLFWNPLWWVTGPVVGASEAAAARKKTAAALSGALDEIVAEVRGSSRLLAYPKNEARAIEATARAERAERGGRFSEAFEAFTEARQLAYPGGGAFTRSRAGLMRVVARMEPKPAIPAKAKEHMIRGEVILRDSGKNEALAEAAKEFNDALWIAPWWPEARFNLGLVLGELGQYDEAIGQLRLYLDSGPRDAADVETKIVEFKVRAERAAK